MHDGNMLTASLARRKKGNIFKRILVQTGDLRSSGFRAGCYKSDTKF